MTSLTKNLHPQAKNFFLVQTRDLLRLLRLLPGLQSILDWINSCSKPHAFRRFFFLKIPESSRTPKCLAVLHKQLSSLNIFCHFCTEADAVLCNLLTNACCTTLFNCIQPYCNTQNVFAIEVNAISITEKIGMHETQDKTLSCFLTRC